MNIICLFSGKKYVNKQMKFINKRRCMRLIYKKNKLIILNKKKINKFDGKIDFSWWKFKNISIYDSYKETNWLT